jgi:hypothetical protein
VFIPVRGDARREIKAGSNGALAVVLVGCWDSPHRHDSVTNELLDHAAIATHHCPSEIEVPGEDLANVFGVFRLGERSEADQIAEKY